MMPLRSFVLLLALMCACEAERSSADAAPQRPDALAMDAGEADAAPDPADGGPAPADAEPAMDAPSGPVDAAAEDAAPGPMDAQTAPDATAMDAGAGPANPLFLAVGGGVRRLISRDGVTWTNNAVVDPRGGDDDNNTRGAAWGGGRFVIGGGANMGFSMVSVDGITWTNEVRNQRSYISQTAFGNGVWVAVGGNGYRVRSRDNGASWTDDSGYYEGHFRRLAFGRGFFVAVGHTYGSSNIGLIGRSADGRVWTTTQQPNLAPLWDVAFGNDVFVASGPTRVTRSPDGVTWTEVAITTRNVESVSFCNGEHLITTAEGLWHSVDGVQWARIDGFAPRMIAYAGGVYLGVDGNGRRFTSTDRMSWRPGILDGPGINDLVVGDVP